MDADSKYYDNEEKPVKRSSKQNSAITNAHRYLEDDIVDDSKEEKNGVARSRMFDSSHKPEQLNRQYKKQTSDDSVDLADQEFESLLHQPNVGECFIPTNPAAKKIYDGLKINWMDMRDDDTKKLLWESTNRINDMFERTVEAHVPKQILRCTAVSRELNFSSIEKIENFRLEQRVFLHGKCIEEWIFKFGFVIPGSTNSWQQVIYAAPPDEMIPPEILSGNVTIESSFIDGDSLICKTLMRIFYD